MKPVFPSIYLTIGNSVFHGFLGIICLNYTLNMDNGSREASVVRFLCREGRDTKPYSPPVKPAAFSENTAIFSGKTAGFTGEGEGAGK